MDQIIIIEFFVFFLILFLIFQRKDMDILDKLNNKLQYYEWFGF